MKRILDRPLTLGDLHTLGDLSILLPAALERSAHLATARQIDAHLAQAQEFTRRWAEGRVAA